MSAATAPTPRPSAPSSGHCPPTTADALARTAAYAPTTSRNGPSTVRYAIPSGAGRTDTRRDRAAASNRATTDAASSSAATRRAARPTARGDSDPSSGPSRRSTSARSSRVNVAVSRATSRACRSPTTPSVRHRIVSGSSSHQRAGDTPTNRSPSVGDSRRASATSDPTDRRASRGAACSRDSRTASTARA